MVADTTIKIAVAKPFLKTVEHAAESESSVVAGLCWKTVECSVVAGFPVDDGGSVVRGKENTDSKSRRHQYGASARILVSK